MAWQKGDILGVEVALRNWAEPGETVQTIHVLNSQPHAVTLCLEPYCEEVTLAPRQAGVVLACGPTPKPHDRLLVECQIERIIVYSWGGSLAYLLAESFLGDSDNSPRRAGASE